MAEQPAGHDARGAAGLLARVAGLPRRRRRGGRAPRALRPRERGRGRAGAPAPRGAVGRHRGPIARGAAPPAGRRRSPMQPRRLRRARRSAAAPRSRRGRSRPPSRRGRTRRPGWRGSGARGRCGPSCVATRSAPPAWTPACPRPSAARPRPPPRRRAAAGPARWRRATGSRWSWCSPGLMPTPPILRRPPARSVSRASRANCSAPSTLKGVLGDTPTKMSEDSAYVSIRTAISLSVKFLSNFYWNFHERF